jgi:hypothetical protein
MNGRLVIRACNLEIFDPDTRYEGHHVSCVSVAYISNEHFHEYSDVNVWCHRNVSFVTVSPHTLQ